MSMLQTPVSLVDGIAEEGLRLQESFAVVDIPLRSMRGTWTTSTICNYDEDRMHLRRLPETSLMQPVTEPTAASRLNSRPSACGFDARNAFTTAPADFAFGAVSSCPSFYRGEQYDSDLSLYYLRARYYNPNTGRFMSRDPENGYAKDPASLHKYLYANGDPINGLDPTGRFNIGELALNLGRVAIKTSVAIVAFAGTQAANLATALGLENLGAAITLMVETGEILPAIRLYISGITLLDVAAPLARYIGCATGSIILAKLDAGAENWLGSRHLNPLITKQVDQLLDSAVKALEKACPLMLWPGIGGSNF